MEYTLKLVLKPYGFTLCGPQVVDYISLMKFEHIFDDFIGDGSKSFQNVTLGRHYSNNQEQHVFNKEFFKRVLDWLMFNGVSCLIDFDIKGYHWNHPMVTFLEPWNPPSNADLAREEGYNDNPLEGKAAWRPYCPIV